MLLLGCGVPPKTCEGAERGLKIALLGCALRRFQSFTNAGGQNFRAGVVAGSFRYCAKRASMTGPMRQGSLETGGCRRRVSTRLEQPAQFEIRIGGV